MFYCLGFFFNAVDCLEFVIRIFSSKRNFSIAKEMEWKYQANKESNPPDKKICQMWIEPGELWKIYFPGFLILFLFHGMDLRFITVFR